MRRPPLLLAALLCVGFVVASCDGGNTTGPGTPIEIAISPALVPTPADGSARPINRIRASAVRVADGGLVGESSVDVSQTDSTWTLSLDVSVPATPIEVRVFVRLIHVENGTETVEFSGVGTPMTVAPGDQLVVADLPILRGPVANHYATGVSITSTPDTLDVAATATLTAVATTDSTIAPTVFWTALDSATLEMNGAVVTGLGAGVGQVVASAGTFADTAIIVVRPPQGLLDIQVSKTAVPTQAMAGDTVVFTITATNAGPGDATDVVVVDALPSAFQVASHTTDLGSVANDTVWSMPALAESQTATWTLTTVVGPGVAGTSATNRAYLASVSPGDGAPANDTALVSVDFPLSAVPVVVIAEPGDSAIFDPGDPITFTASALDPEEGDLSATISWTSNIDGGIGTGASFSTSTLSTGLHTIVASASDSDGGVGADTVHVTVALYTVPPTLNVPFGGTASLPITLSQPAPSGGVDLSVSSDDPSVTEPTASTVSIAEGALSGNATLTGLVPGTANITIGNALYGSAVTAASVTAELDILVTSISFASPFTETFTIQLESQGTPIAAPAGGLSVTLTSADPACVAPTSSVTIPAGQVAQTADLAYGGSATTPCQAYVYSTSGAVTADSVLVTVDPPSTITVGPRTVGAGLQQTSSGSLGVSNHGGTTLTLTSTDPSVLLLSPDASTAGTASIQLQIPDGTSSYSFYVQGVENTTGTPSVTADAAGFGQGSATMTVVPAGLVLSGLSTSTTTQAPDDEFYASIGAISGNSVSVQNVRAGGSPVTVTFTSSNVQAGVLTDGSVTGDTVTAVIPVGLYYTPTSLATGGVAFDATGAGSTTVEATAPNVQTQVNGSLTVSVTTPNITVSARTVGSGLQSSANGTLGATGHGGITLRIASSDAQTLLVSPDATTPGTAFIDIVVPNGQSGFSYYVQGVEGATGSPTVTATATGFNTGQATMQVVQPGVQLSGLIGSTTTFSPDDEFYASVGIPSGNGLSVQNVRAGGSAVTVTFASDTPGVIQLTDGVNSGASVTATVPIGLYYTPTTVASGGVAAQPVGGGTAEVTARATGFVAQPNATMSVSVSAPAISVSARTVGAGLQVSGNGSMGATAHGGVTLRLTSSDPSVLLVSPDATTPGAAFIDLVIPDGISGFSYYVQGVEGTTGPSTVTATATGFTSGSAGMTVVQPGVVISGLQPSLFTLSPDDDFYASVGIPSGTSVSVQNVRAGGAPLTVTFVTDDSSVGLLTDGSMSGDTVTATIPVGLYYSPTTVGTGGVAHNPVTSGSATITASVPGFVTQPNGIQSVTVTTPMITVNPRTVGSGLQVASGGNLGASAHGGVTLRLTSSDPGTFLLSPDQNTAGATFVDIAMPDGQSSFSFYVQGFEGATGAATVTATANGFIDGSTTVTVVRPRITLLALSASNTAGGANDDFYVGVGIPSGNSVSVQNVRAGGTAITATVTSSNTAAAVVAMQSSSGASVSADIVPGLYYTPTSFAGGGFTLDPIAAGQTTVEVTAAEADTGPTGTVTVTIGP